MLFFQRSFSFEELDLLFLLDEVLWTLKFHRHQETVDQPGMEQIRPQWLELTTFSKALSRDTIAELQM